MNWHVFETCVWWCFQNYIASATAVELGVVIFIFELWCTMNYLWTLCNIWHGCWIMYDLGLYVGCFEVLRDTRRTTGFIRAQVWQRGRSGDWHCTCALINWSVLLQLASKQDLTLLVTCVIKTKVFVLQNPFWQLIVIYIGVQIWNLKSKVCEWSIPLCPVKDFRWLIKY